MTRDRDAIIQSLKRYFSITELVCPDVYKKFNERAWQFFTTDALYGLLLLRETILCRPMYLNSYKKGRTQRGLRCNLCALVKGKATVYLSQHVFGNAWDFDVEGMTAEQARQEIKKKAHLFPCQIRLEKDKSWVHIDFLSMYGITSKVYEFNG